MTRLHGLPLSDLRCELVLLRARKRFCRKARCQLVPYMLTQHWRHLSLFAEVALGAGIAAATARVNEIGQRLRSCCTFVEVRSLPAERVCRHHRLRAERRVTYWTVKFDLL